MYRGNKNLEGFAVFMLQFFIDLFAVRKQPWGGARRALVISSNQRFDVGC